ncbi:FAD-dependent thymidylate synthase [Bradyrhizobium sp. BRP05]|nr:FAD-dependent thymidylate synthase [Bradyrhizobium sp. BRP05]
MTISAKMIAHSTSYFGKEIWTVLARYPRFIHAEELTHRILSSTPDMIIEINDGVMYDRNLSRNASSSRAIPVSRLIDDILRDTAMPIHWGKNQKGMQADHEHNAPVGLFDEFGHYLECTPEEAWIIARDRAIDVAKAYDRAGYHKQIVNRLLEPFAHINVLITATEWDNFFELRDHADAQPEIQALARAIRAEFQTSTPRALQPGEWHLPFVTDVEMQTFELDVVQKLSVARCARTSYLTHEGKVPTIAQDLDLFDRLVGSRPLHASPAEHQATPDRQIRDVNIAAVRWESPDQHGNFVGWCQYRKQLEGTIQ